MGEERAEKELEEAGEDIVGAVLGRVGRGCLGV